MGKHGIDDLVYSKAREIVYEEVKWTATENTFRSRIVEKGDSKFSDCLADEIADSTIGSAIGVPVEDRQGILDIAQRRNHFTDDEDSVIERLTNLPASLDVSTVGQFLTTLRLVECEMTEIDKSLRQLKNLKLLNLSRNKISNLSGDRLPRKLLFLELYMNEIRDVRPLSSSAPKDLTHLGLARNKLADGSGLETLSKNPKTILRSLDIADNDIENLKVTLSELSPLPLASLQLEGNPCSMCPSYVHDVASRLPKLSYLDGARPNVTHPPADGSGGLVFRCFGFTGVDENKCIYHAELDIPLFDPVRRLSVINALITERETEEGSLWFPTEGISWSNVMDFPVLIVRVPYFAGLTELRDVFRSTVSVRIVKTIPTEVIAEFDVDLEGMPWWATPLTYKWTNGSRKAERICQGVKDDQQSGLGCLVSFAVEGLNV